MNGLESSPQSLSAAMLLDEEIYLQVEGPSGGSVSSQGLLLVASQTCPTCTMRCCGSLSVGDRTKHTAECPCSVSLGSGLLGGRSVTIFVHTLTPLPQLVFLILGLPTSGIDEASFSCCSENCCHPLSSLGPDVRSRYSAPRRGWLCSLF